MPNRRAALIIISTAKPSFFFHSHVMPNAKDAYSTMINTQDKAFMAYLYLLLKWHSAIVRLNLKSLQTLELLQRSSNQPK